MEALKKIKSEMDANIGNQYVQYIGKFLNDHLAKNPSDGAKVMDGDKTILKSLEAMRAEASKKKVGNFAILTPEEGIEIVLKYFGITSSAVAPIPVVSSPAAAPKKVDFELSLNDLL